MDETHDSVVLQAERDKDRIVIARIEDHLRTLTSGNDSLCAKNADLERRLDLAEQRYHIYILRAIYLLTYRVHASDVVVLPELNTALGNIIVFSKVIGFALLLQKRASQDVCHRLLFGLANADVIFRL